MAVLQSGQQRWEIRDEYMTLTLPQKHVPKPLVQGPPYLDREWCGCCKAFGRCWLGCVVPKGAGASWAEDKDVLNAVLGNRKAAWGQG